MNHLLTACQFHTSKTLAGNIFYLYLLLQEEPLSSDSPTQQLKVYALYKVKINNADILATAKSSI